MSGEAGEDLRDLRGSLAFAEDHFWHPLSESAVVIDLGESEVFKGEMAKTLDGFIGRQLFGAHLGKKIMERFGIHGVRIILVETAASGATAKARLINNLAHYSRGSTTFR